MYGRKLEESVYKKIRDFISLYQIVFTFKFVFVKYAINLIKF